MSIFSWLPCRARPTSIGMQVAWRPARNQLQVALQIAKGGKTTDQQDLGFIAVVGADFEIQDNNYIDARKLLEPLLGDESSRKREAGITLRSVLLMLGDVQGARAPLESALKSIEQHQSSLLPLAHSVLGELEYQANRAAAGRAHLTMAITSWTDALPDPLPTSRPSATEVCRISGAERRELSSDLKGALNKQTALAV